jgi:hypothetical protein
MHKDSGVLNSDAPASLALSGCAAAQSNLLPPVGGLPRTKIPAPIVRLGLWGGYQKNLFRRVIVFTDSLLVRWGSVR